MPISYRKVSEAWELYFSTDFAAGEMCVLISVCAHTLEVAHQIMHIGRTIKKKVQLEDGLRLRGSHMNLQGSLKSPKFNYFSIISLISDLRVLLDRAHQDLKLYL